MVGKILWPLVYNEIRRNKISNTFGRFPERISGSHWGWDFYAAKETPCFAISDGTIEMIYGAASDTGNFGLVSVLAFKNNGSTLYAAYCHLSSVAVVKDQKLNAGDLVGYTGNSGNASNMSGLDEHLHFEIRTTARPGPGQKGRQSPLTVFGKCPLQGPIIEP